MGDKADRRVEKTFFDTDFFSDPKVEFLLNEFGPVGVTYYLKIALTILSEGGSLNSRIAASFLKKFGAADELVVQFLKACVDIELLYMDSDGTRYRSRRADREIEELHGKREKWRQKQDRYRESQQTRRGHLVDAQGNPRDVTMVSPDTLGRHSVDSEKEHEQEEEQEREKDPEGELEQEPERPRKVKSADPPDKREWRPHVWLTDAEAGKFIADFGREFFDRCCDKLSAWIEQDPTPKRRRNGRNAAATFRVWVINAVSEEQARFRGPPKVTESPMAMKQRVARETLQKVLAKEAEEAADNGKVVEI